MDLESLLRQSDPATRADLPDFESVVGHRVHDEIMSRTFDREGSRVRLWNRGRLRVSVAAIFAVAGVITLIATLVPGTNGSSQSAAAAVLNHLASQAAQEPTTLGAGQYYYTEVQQPTTISEETLPSGAVLSSYVLGTVQTWVAADGSGRQVTTTDPTPRFFTSGDQALWIAAGKPPIPIPPNQLSSTQDFGPGSASEVNGPVPLYDVSGLPTDPSALATVLSNENPGRTSLGMLPAGISALDSGTLFTRTVALLQGPDVGATSALRMALYQVLATVPGMQLLGTTTDPAGQSGLGFRLVERMPAGTATVTCEGRASGSGSPAKPLTVPYPASATTYTIVIDPQTTTLISSEEGFPPSVQSGVLAPCSPQPTPQTTTLNPTWMSVLAEGVVDSETSTQT